MKLQREYITPELREALLERFREAIGKARSDFDSLFGSEIAAFDSDFIHTTNVNDARWLFSDNRYDYAIVRINTDGSMTNLVRE